MRPVRFLIPAAAALALAAPGDAVPEGLPLTGRTIAIDPGHNGGNASHPERINRKVDAGGFKKACDTTGTATDDSRLAEHAFNWDLARRLRSELEALGADVVMTRRNDRGVGPCIDERAAIGNRARADAAISLHADGAARSARGFHIIHPASRRARKPAIVRPSRRLAVIVRRELKRAGLKTSNYAGRSGLSERDDLGGLNLSTVPKVFVEHGNMRSPADARLLKSARWRAGTAKALAAALQSFLAS